MHRILPGYLFDGQSGPKTDLEIATKIRMTQQKIFPFKVEVVKEKLTAYGLRKEQIFTNQK